MPDLILRLDDTIPVDDKGRIHLVGSLPWAIAVPDDVLMFEVRIRNTESVTHTYLDLTDGLVRLSSRTSESLVAVP